MAQNEICTCPKCKEEISAEARICPFCGVTIKKEKKRKKKRSMLPLIILIWVVLGLVIIGAGLYIGYTYFLTSFDCKELLDVHFDGSNKSAIGYITLDSDLNYFTATETGKDGTPRLSDVFDTDTERAKELQSLLKKYIYIADDPRDATYKATVDGKVHTGTTLSKMTGIKNGDIITVKVSYDRWALLKKGVRLENTEFDIKVTGLTTGATLDPFKNVKCVFTGIDGYGTAEVDLSKCTAAVTDNFSYTVSPNMNLSEGDTVTITASYKGESYDESTGIIEYGGKFYSISKQSRKTVTIGELTAVSTLDPFEGVTITYEGIDPYLKITGFNTSASPKAVKQFFDYEASATENLKAGQVITVKAVYKTVDGKQYTDKDLEKAGFTLLKTERTYPVSDAVSKYAKSTADFDMNKVAESFSAYLSKYKTGSNKVSLVKNFFGVKKDPKTSLAYNRYYEIYKIEEGGKTVYAALSAESIYKDAGGKLHFTTGISGNTSPNLEKIVSSAVHSDDLSYNIAEAKLPESPINNFNVTTTTAPTATTQSAEGQQNAAQ